MSDKPVHERISHRIMVYVGTAGKLANQFSIEDIIKEELKPMESQLREADVTSTAMGLALTEARIENLKLVAALDVAETYVGGLHLINGVDLGVMWSVLGVIRHALKKEGA